MIDESPQLAKKSEAKGFIPEYRDDFTDLETVESQRNDLIPEEFPEGPYGTSLNTESLGKSSPWRKDQRPSNPFSYENRELHEGIKRDYPGEDDYRNEPTNEE
ncbi:hypothetical protein M5X11_14230 [Paenibacillus alginolyticus]|uniref:Cytosolic protein n=1 Tax=Paenibacillus alginolyticus TaxID=59839 RepID=A0ABT4G981_9BACL|nr:MULTISPECIES: hypothetical protein [Paenibacillus]MCY9666110.1 hypothetical protein [Paenibacillus alginolyticus]MCY9692745.1 hypothetical protein [Paenibacillus alginolyticus]MEC0146402.1 hypothetical protein [Paenibacillus alginolyticus]NRF93233.1 hypothetical protein [Paenibacillus frigoriresistens]